MKKTNLIDLHNHMLFGVDDGSDSLETSIQMIKKSIHEGVKTIVLTPHVLSRVTKASKETHVKHFEILKDKVSELNLDIELILGAEINYKAHLDIDYDTYAFGLNKTILIEFSPDVETPIEDIVFNLVKKGYQVIIAHVERYSNYLSYSDYVMIKHTGAYLQVNSSSIMGYESKKHKKLIKKLLSDKLIDVIASDSHNLEYRAPNLGQCYTYLEKHVPASYLEDLFVNNPKKLIS